MPMLLVRLLVRILAIKRTVLHTSAARASLDWTIFTAHLAAAHRSWEIPRFIYYNLVRARFSDGA